MIDEKYSTEIKCDNVLFISEINAASAVSSSSSTTTACNSSSSSSASEFELDYDFDSDSIVESKSEPEIKETELTENVTTGKILPIELSFSIPGYLILSLFCIGHESMFGMVKMAGAELIETFNFDDDLAHLMFAITGFFMLRFSGGVWFWSTNESKEYESFRNIMKNRIRESNADTLASKFLKFDLQILKWFRRHKRFQGIWNIVGFYLSEIAAVYLFEEHIATAFCSIPKVDLFESLPSAQLHQSSFNIQNDPIPPIGKRFYKSNHQFDIDYHLILDGENLQHISQFPINGSTTLNVGNFSSQYQCTNEQQLSQEHGTFRTLINPQVIMTNTEEYKDLEDWFIDIYEKDKEYLKDILTDESFDALFGDGTHAMFDFDKKFALYFISAIITFCALKRLRFDIFHNENF